MEKLRAVNKKGGGFSLSHIVIADVSTQNTPEYIT